MARASFLWRWPCRSMQSDDSGDDAEKRALPYPRGAFDAFTETEFVGLGSSVKQGYNPDDPAGNVMRQNHEHFGLDGRPPVVHPHSRIADRKIARVAAKISGHELPPHWLVQELCTLRELVEDYRKYDAGREGRGLVRSELEAVISFFSNPERIDLLGLLPVDFSRFRDLVLRQAQTALDGIPEGGGRGKRKVHPGTWDAKDVCASVMTEAWRLFRPLPGESNGDMIRAAEDYWIATGGDPSQRKGFLTNLDQERRVNSRWIKHLTRAGEPSIERHRIVWELHQAACAFN